MSLPQTTPDAPDWPDSPSGLRQQAHRLLDCLLDFCSADQPTTFLAFEKELLARLLCLGQILVGLFLLTRHQRLDLTPWLQRGYRLSDHDAKRTLQTAFGPVPYRRAYLAAKSGGTGIHPLDATLGLTRDSFSPLVIGLFCRLATRLGFSLACRMGATFLGWAPAPSAVNELVVGLGRPAYVYLSAGPLPEGDGDVLVTEFDGKAVPTATEEELTKRRSKRPKKGRSCCQRHRSRTCRKCRGKKKKRKKGDKSKNGRSATLVVMYTLKRGDDGRLHGPINKKVYASFGPRRKALEWARAQATRRGFGPDSGKKIQIVLDGELCLEQGARELFPGAVVTLDCRHAQEKLWQAGRLFHKEGSEELSAWVEELEGLLFEGKTEELLTKLREALAGVSLRGPGTKAKREKLGGIIVYLEKRVGMMDYGAWREQDLVIASGVVEGAARYVIGERLDNSGMRWIEERAEALLLLRCIEVNGDWDHFWAWADQQRRTDLAAGLPIQIRSKQPTHFPEAA